MKYNIHTNPFLHITISDLITKEENDELYEYFIECLRPYENSINDYSIFILEKDLLEKNGLNWCIENDLLQNSVTIDKFINYNDRFFYLKDEILKRLNNLHKEVLNEFPTVSIIDNNQKSEFVWDISFSLANDKQILFPHTDSIEQICYECGITDSFEIKNSKLPRYRGILYLGDRTIDYKDYGTKYYVKEEENLLYQGKESDYISHHEFKEPYKEIEFIPGHSHIFKVSEESFHGTDFKSGFNYKRIFGSISYAFNY
jgi:hypothetical protein